MLMPSALLDRYDVLGKEVVQRGETVVFGSGGGGGIPTHPSKGAHVCLEHTDKKIVLRFGSFA